MRSKFIFSLVLLILMRACSGADGDVESLWAPYEGEVFVAIYLASSEDDPEAPNANNAWKFLSYIGDGELDKVSSYATLEGKVAYTNENGLELSSRKQVALQDEFKRIPDTKYFVSNIMDESFSVGDSIYWFEDGENPILKSAFLMHVLPLNLDKIEYTWEEVESFVKEEFDDEDVYVTEYKLFDSMSMDEVEAFFVDSLQVRTSLSFGDEIIHRDMLIRPVKVDHWSQVDNRFSDYHQEDVFLIGVEIENKSDSTNKVNMYSYEVYGPNKKSAKVLSSYFDNTLDYGDKLLSGGKDYVLIPILYEGDGEYQIHFDHQIFYLDIKK